MKPIARDGIRIDPGSAAKFALGVALLGIFFDASVGHGLTWENDPYWTYWVTKTFLIATIFALGTAWLGVGEVQGAVITAVHTLVLTIYYWSLSPIGIPSSSEWLDLEHTWVTGVPIHFAVIYLGYLATLWIWRRRLGRVAGTGDTAAHGIASLAVGLAIVVVAGGLSSLALGLFPGITWFVVRLLLTVTFLYVWWAIVGRDVTAAVVGGAMLALVWAAYSQYLGPIGLPNWPLRILDAHPPAAVSRWLDYREIWVISFPIDVLVMAAALYATARRWVRP